MLDIMIVIIPIQERKIKIGEVSIHENLINIKIPAATIVAECINAETGVGPCMAADEVVSISNEKRELDALPGAPGCYLSFR
jgi:hypothetical protein